MHKEEIKQLAKKRYANNVKMEIEKKSEVEDRIKDLERKENELIEMLQKTNQLELLAMEDLKKVLNDENPEFFKDLLN